MFTTIKIVLLYHWDRFAIIRQFRKNDRYVKRLERLNKKLIKYSMSSKANAGKGFKLHKQINEVMNKLNIND